MSDQYRECGGAGQLARLDEEGIATCPICGALDGNATASDLVAYGFVSPHLSLLPATTHPNRRDRMLFMADRFYRLEALVCKMLARRHPFWRPLLWLLFTMFEVGFFTFVLFFGGLTQIPALLDNRFDDVESVIRKESD